MHTRTQRQRHTHTQRDTERDRQAAQMPCMQSCKPAQPTQSATTNQSHTQREVVAHLLPCPPPHPADGGQLGPTRASRAAQWGHRQHDRPASERAREREGGTQTAHTHTQWRASHTERERERGRQVCTHTHTHTSASTDRERERDRQIDR